MKTKLKITAVIPCRMASTRFPGKPLADICGLPMIEHIRRRVALSKMIDEVIVATCDRDIFDTVNGFGGRAIMTSNCHERCTDRVAEAAQGISADVIINVQGDEPFVRPEMLELALRPFLREKGLNCVNLMAEIDNDEDFNSPNVIKTVCDTYFNAVYFSRLPIPSLTYSKVLAFKKYKQLGIIAFTKEFLKIFSGLSKTPLENAESIDMLRAIEHGYKVRMVLSPHKSWGVDTIKDLEKAVTLMKNDDLLSGYLADSFANRRSA